MNLQKLNVKSYFVAALVAGLAACSGGSGEGVQESPPPPAEGGDGGVVYNGPVASTDDVQNFKLNVWDNLAGTDRCGSCHVQDGQVPSFVRSDDVNLAYAEANNIVNIESPSESRMVTKVAEGHNCWVAEASVCETIITNFIQAWATESGAEPEAIQLDAPTEREVGASKSFPSDPGNYATTVYPLLSAYCVNCHSENSNTQQQPFLASDDVAVSYQSAKSKINLDDPANSRLVTRLRNEFHNCWDNCTANAMAMQTAIANFSDSIPLTEVDPALVISRASGLPDAFPASSGGRIQTNVIALYEFKTGSGTVAYDTSGVSPSLDLNLLGNVEWVGSWGIRINDGRAQGPTSTSQKLHAQIGSTGEYSIEAWVIPDNVVQDGPARIVTYSGGQDARNFTVGQTTYDYNFMSRSSEADSNGMPMLSTPSADEVLQATLQHVVVNFDPIDGRSIYVNGERVAQNTTQPGNLNDWDPTFALAVGSEVDGNDLWMGTVRLLAIHNRVLSEEDIVANFESGVGQKFFMLFGVSHLVDVPEAYIVFEVEQFDNYSYLFNSPSFISLDTTVVPDNLVIQGLRLGVNGQEIAVGQSYANLDVTINSDNYINTETGTPLSNLGALVPLDRGPDDDQFFLSFDRIGRTSYARPADPVAQPLPPEPAGEQSDIGVRTFDEVNATLSAVTTVPVTNTLVANTFAVVRQQLPTVETVEGFLSSHQSGVMQLSVAYCTSLINDTTRRASFFPGFNFSANFATAFGGAGKSQVIQPLLSALLANDIDIGGGTVSLGTSPTPSDLEAELSSLIDKMSSSDTQTAVIATCASAMGSAVMLVQ